MSSQVDVDWQEALMYRPGQRVELKAQPGVFDTIASYEATMVPPIWLANDPKPRYPHELRVVQLPVLETGWLKLNHHLKARAQGQRQAHVSTGSNLR
jgi:hypothetical protein